VGRTERWWRGREGARKGGRQTEAEGGELSRARIGVRGWMCSFFASVC